MSVIVVVRKGAQAVIAADTLQSDDAVVVSSEYVKNHRKLVACGEAILGLAGWSATQDVMESIIRHHADEMDFTSRVTLFESARKIHAVLKSDYFLSPQEDKEQPVESSQIDMLVAAPAGIFELESYRSVTEYTRFWAIGSGRRLAIGAMHAVYDLYDDPAAIARAGVAAACEFDEGCALPLNLRTVVLAESQAD